MNVIGAGPTGSIAGIELLKKGYSPVLHDRFGKENYKYVRCSGIISDKAFNYYSKYIKFNVLNELKKLMVDFNSETLVIKPRKKAYVISRADLNRDLLDKYLSMGGDFIHENINSDDLFKMKGHIIGADGPSSAVAQTFNFPKFDNVFNTAQTFIDSKDFELDTARIFLNVKGVFGWLFPHGDKCELGLATIGNAKHALLKLSKFLNVTIDSPQYYHIIPFGPRESIGKSLMGKKVYLVGDAAGHAKPTTGGGLYYGARSANMLVDSIHLGQTPEQYQEMWHQQIGPNFKVMRLINRSINLIPMPVLPLTGMVLKSLKFNKFMDEWGDMEDMSFFNLSNIHKFASDMIFK